VNEPKQREYFLFIDGPCNVVGDGNNVGPAPDWVRNECNRRGMYFQIVDRGSSPPDECRKLISLNCDLETEALELIDGLKAHLESKVKDPKGTTLRLYGRLIRKYELPDWDVTTAE
jgi:hypothetical protein